MLAVNIGNKLFGYNGMLIASIFVIVGHNYPVLLGFKGGRNMAASIGDMLSLHWPYCF